MWKWMGRLFLVAVVGFLALATYGHYRGGYFSIPDLEENEYPISFRSGFRAIVVDPEVSDPSFANVPRFFRRLSLANPDRKYIGVPYEVPAWFKDAWSYCEKPTDEETRVILDSMPDNMRRHYTSARLDAICKINSDGQVVFRGALFSVPER